METNTQAVDPLSQAAGGIDTNFPLLQDGTFMRFECREAKQTETQEKKTKQITMKWVTTKEAVDQNNRSLNAGFPVYVRINAEATETRDVQQLARDWAQVLKAAGQPQVSARQVIDNPSLLVGMIADAKVAIFPEKNGFAASNVLRWKLPA